MPIRPKQHKNSSPSAKKFKPKNAGNKDRGELYDSTWEKYRKVFLHYNHTCYICPNKSVIVDHIIAHKGDKVLFEKLDNHMPLCKRCHDTLTAMFDRFSPPKTNEKIKYIVELRQRFNITTKVKVMVKYGT